MAAAGGRIANERAMTNLPTGVLLLNLGGPWSLDQVRPFLRTLFGDRTIMPLPGGAVLQGAWAGLLATLRRRAVEERYRQIGGRSPLLYWSRLQALGLVRRLNETGSLDASAAEQDRLREFDSKDPGLPADMAPGFFEVALGMRYSTPTIQAALRLLTGKGCRRIAVVPLYPQECLATTGSSLRELERVHGPAEPDAPELVAVRAFHQHPGYVRALADRTREGLARYPASRRGEVTVLFSAHGIPLRMATSGDPYVAQVQETVAAVRGALTGEIGPTRLAWQSKVGPLRWTSPTVQEVIRELGAKGCRDLLIVPVSFVSDHIETLHEIDIEFVQLAREAGIEQCDRAPALNDSPAFLDALCDIVRAALGPTGRGLENQR